MVATGWPHCARRSTCHLSSLFSQAATARTLSEVRQALTPLPLVACDTGFVPASSCYFASETVTTVLGAHTPIARPLGGHERSTTSLYEWLGVAKEPRLPDVVTRARQLAAADQ